MRMSGYMLQKNISIEKRVAAGRGDHDHDHDDGRVTGAVGDHHTKPQTGNLPSNQNKNHERRGTFRPGEPRTQNPNPEIPAIPTRR
ncbi:unnamed protein product [Boreogadus saida]